MLYCVTVYTDDNMSSSSRSPFSHPQPFAMLGDTSRSSSNNSISGGNSLNSISRSMHQDIAAAAAAAGSASSSGSRTTRGAHNANTNYGRKYKLSHHSVLSIIIHCDEYYT